MIYTDTSVPGARGGRRKTVACDESHRQRKRDSVRGSSSFRFWRRTVGFWLRDDMNPTAMLSVVKAHQSRAGGCDNDV